VWHRGVNLCYEKSFAEIIETYGEINTFEIKIAGFQKRELLAIIRENFGKIIKPFKKLYYKELIPCNCEKCKKSDDKHFYIYENLRTRIEKNKFVVECEKSYEEVDVRMLLTGIILDKNQNPLRNKVFISYSHKDSDYLAKVQRQLKVLEMEGLQVNLWDDTQIKPGMKWLDEIKKNLQTAKVAILLISTDFLISDFITTKEVPDFLKSAENKGTTIIPLIIKPCRFENNKSLSQFQAVHNPNQPLSDFSENEQDKILLKLVDRIEELIGN